MRGNNYNLIKLARLLAERFIKKAVGESDPFKGRFEFIDSSDLFELEESFRNFKSRQINWEHLPYLSFESSNPNFSSVNIYKPKRLITSYVIPIDNLEYWFEYSATRNLNYLVSGDNPFPLSTFSEQIFLPKLVYILRDEKNGIYKIGFGVDPELVFGASRPEHIAAALNVLAESYIDTQTIIDTVDILLASDPKKLDKMRRGEIQLSPRLSTTVGFFLNNFHHLELYQPIVEHDLTVEAMVWSIFEAKLRGLPQPIAEAGNRLLRFVTGYYDRLTRKYFTDYNPDINPIIKLKLANTMRTIRNVFLRILESSYYGLALSLDEGKRIDFNLNVTDTQNAKYNVPIYEYWPQQWKEVAYHLSRGNIDRVKKLLDYVKYIFSPEIPHPEALEKLGKFDSKTEAFFRELEKMVGKKLPGLRAVLLYWQESKPYERELMMEGLKTLAEKSRNMSEASNLHLVKADINNVSFAAMKLDIGLTDSANEFVATDFIRRRYDAHNFRRYDARDFENLIDLVYRNELVRCSGFMSIHRDLYYDGKLHMNTEILPEGLKSYVWDTRLFDPTFENIKKFNWMVLKNYTNRPEFKWAIRFRGRR
jgi:hypothetical protein